MTRFADGTGAWTLLEAVLLSDESPRATRPGVHVVRTPLDLICLLEREEVDEVVLGGSFARNGYIRAFLHETYPRVVVSHPTADTPPSTQTVARSSATDAANTSG